MTEKKKGGRPKFSPSEKDKNTVKVMAAAGIQQSIIAKVVGVSVPTLGLHFRRELDTAAAEANAQVAASLFKQATDSKKPNVAAAIFWLKTRAGWVENAPAGLKETREAKAEAVTNKFASIKAPNLKAFK